MAAVSKKGSVVKSFSTGKSGKPTSIVYGGRPITWRKKQANALRGTAVAGPRHPRKDSQR
jgi:hypothetical protein